MIRYDSKDILKILFSWRGSIIAIDSRLNISLFCTVAIAITLVATHQENDLSIERHGSTYIAILGKVLVFFMVFRSKLTYDRYTDARKSVQVMFNQLKQMAQSTSIYIDGEAEADKADRAELYRLQTVVLVTMLVHMRKDTNTLKRIYAADKAFDEDGKQCNGVEGWVPDREEAQLDKACELGIVTRGERRKLLDAGLSYVSLAQLWYSLKLVEVFKNGKTHRNLMMDIDRNLQDLAMAWLECEKIALNPFPFPYVQALGIFLLMFIYTMPLALISQMGVMTPVATFLLVLGYCGLDAVGSELEDPFGYDANDFPMEEWLSNVHAAVHTLYCARDAELRVGIACATRSGDAVVAKPWADIAQILYAGHADGWVKLAKDRRAKLGRRLSMSRGSDAKGKHQKVPTGEQSVLEMG